MNHIYKSIFNKALGVFTAVPEFASAHGKGSERTVVGRVAKGTAGFAASALAISIGLALTSTSAVGYPGIYINDRQAGNCTAINDSAIPNLGVGTILDVNSTPGSVVLRVPGTSTAPAGVTPSHYNAAGSARPCEAIGNSTVDNRETQTNRTLFYGGPGAATEADEVNNENNGAKNLTLGGRLDVNSGIIGVGDRGVNGLDSTNSIRMGMGTALSDDNKKTDAVTIGVNAGASAKHATAIGSATTAKTGYSTALGYKAQAGDPAVTLLNGEYATAIGGQAKALNAQATAVGAESVASGVGQTSIGAYAGKNGTGDQVRQSYGVFIGRFAGSDNQNPNAATEGGNSYGVSIGESAGRYGQGGTRNTAIGEQAGQYLKGSHNIAMGTNAGSGSATDKLEVSNTTAIGNAAQALTTNSISIGLNSKSGKADAFSGENSIAIGSIAEAMGTSSIAMGSHASTSNGHDSIALGTYATTENQKATAIGSYSAATGRQSLTIANNYDSKNLKPVSVASGARATVIGAETTVSGDNSVAIGDTNTIASARTYALGNNINAAAGTDDSLVFGTRAAVSARDTIAMGNTAQAKTRHSIAIGQDSSAGDDSANAEQKGVSAVAIGHGAKANYYDAIAIGARATVAPAAGNTTAADSIAIGVEATADNYKTTAIGTYARAKGRQSTVIANNVQGSNYSTASGDRSQVYGVETTVSGNNSVAIGDTNTVASNRTYAIGNNINIAEAAVDSLAFGTKAGVKSARSIAIGAEASAGSTDTTYNPLGDIRATAIGSEAKANGLRSVALGDVAVASERYGTALGSSSNVSAAYGTAVGFENRVSGDGGFAAGTHSVAAGRQQISIGHFAGDNVANSGVPAKAADYGVFIGRYAGSDAAGTTGNNYGIAIGAEAGRYQQGGEDNYAIGQNAGQYVNGTHSVALGLNAGSHIEGDGNFAAADGAGNYIKGRNNIAIGNNAGSGAAGAIVEADRTISVGTRTQARGDNAVAIGTDSKALAVDATAVGQAAQASAEKTVAVGQGAKATERFTVAMGHNATASHANSVALGTNSATSDVHTGDYTLNTSYTAAGLPNAANGTVSVGSVGKERQIQNVAAGVISATSTDAINGSQLYATNNYMNNFAGDVKTKLGGNAALDNDGHLTMTDIGGTGKDNVNDAIAAANTKVAAGENITVTPTTNADGSKTYTVATKKDLVVDSVKAGDTTMNKDGLTIAGGPSVKKDGINAGDKKITGVADGNVAAGSKEAVNGGQLAEVKAKADSAVQNVVSANPTALTATKAGDTVTLTPNVIAGDLVNPATGAVNTPAAGDAGKLVTAGTVANALANTHFVVDTAKTDGELDAASKHDQKIKSGNKVTLQAGKNLKAKQTNAADGATVEFSLKDSISLTQVTAGTGANQVVLGNDGVKVGGNTYINNDGLNANNKPISNVADGVKPKDAVNKGQLDAVAQEAAKHTTVKAGKNVEVTESNNAAGGKEYTVKTADNLNVTSVKAGDSTLNTDGLTIAGGPSVKKDGINAGDKKITNVAPGTVAAGSKDAVNGGQLAEVKAKADSAVQNVVSTNPTALTANKVGDTVTLTPNFIAGDLVNADGTVKDPAAADEGKLVSAKTVADALKANHFVVDTKANGGTVDAASEENAKVGSGNKVTFEAGKNLVAQQTNTANGGATVNYKLSDTLENLVSVKSAEIEAGIGPNKVVLNNNGVKVGDSTLNDKGLTINNGPSVTDAGIDAGNKKITGVANGNVAAGSTDAVNGGQLAEVKSKADSAVQDVKSGDENALTAVKDPNTNIVTVTPKLSGDLVDANGNITAPTTPEEKGKLVTAGTVAEALANTHFVVDTAKTDGELDAASKHDQKIKASNKVTLQAGKNLKAKQTNGANGAEVEFSLKDSISLKEVKVGEGSANEVVLNNNGVNVAGNTYINKDGLNANDKKITNVAPGAVTAASKDAVNGSQLYNVANNVKDLIGPDAAIDPATGKVTVADPAKGIGETGKGNIGDAIKHVNDAAKAAADTAKKHTTVEQGDNIVVEESLNADGGKHYKVSTARDLNVDSVKAGDTTVNNDGVTIAGGPSVTKGGINAGGNTITNVADGVNPNDAVNKGQLDKVAGVADSAVKSVDVANGEQNLVVDNSDPKNPKLSLKKDLTVDSVTAGDSTLNNDGLTIAGGPSVKKDGIDAADKKITNVAAGDVAENSKDAVNGGQLYDVAKNVADLVGPDAKIDPATGKVTVADPAKGIGETGKGNIGDAIKHVNDAAKAAADTAKKHTTVEQGDNIVVEESLNADGGKHYKVSTARDLNVDSVKAGDTTVNNDGVTIAGGPSVTKGGINAGGNTITNVADGVNPEDAVNKGQLDKVDTKVSNVAQNVVNVLGGDATVNGNGDITMSNIGETGKGNINDAIKSVNDLAKKAAAEKTSVKAKEGRSNVTVTEGVNAAGGHEYTVDVERSVTNAGSDYVTVTNNHDADTNTTTYTVDVSAKTKASLAKADSAVQGLTSKDGNLNFTKGANGNVEVSFNDNLNVKNVTTDRVQVANGPNMSKDGINAAGKAISNVANGNVAADSKDAVNGGQLHETAKSVADVIGGGATVKDGKVVAGQNGIGNTGQNTVHGAIAAINQNTANNFNQIRGDLRKMDRDLRGGIAGALATAGLPQAFRPGKSMVAAAASTYRGQSGLAIGVSRISDNGKVILKVTGNTNSRGDFGGTIGAGYQW